MTLTTRLAALEKRTAATAGHCAACASPLILMPAEDDTRPEDDQTTHVCAACGRPREVIRFVIQHADGEPIDATDR